ncbi:hypothetical protein SAY87_025911 [Trapa incisa]|uniref:DAGKc domain-containing protein n=1 Tax=Trapa incisa TaxID=236973 RepID=A0AAN7JJI5_9MYRT|nr:hypothetical protein SAY87_025911 [Trapa incisa]
MQKSWSLSRASNLRVAVPQQSLRRMGLCSPGGGQHASPVVFPEKRGSKVKTPSSKQPVNPTSMTNDDLLKSKNVEHRIDIIGGGGDEKSDLLGYVVLTGKLFPDKRKRSDENHGKDRRPSSGEATTHESFVDAKLTSKALVWGSNFLALDDAISVTYITGLRYFTVHAYPEKRASCGFSYFMKGQKRSRKDFRFVAPSKEEAVHWVGGFADLQCYVNCLPHPVSSKKQASSELLPVDPPPELIFRCKNPPRMLVILNPRSGRGRSSKVFYGIVEPIFKLAGFQLEVVKTTSAGHAKELASSVDFSTCPDGIICVGGDGIINEVLNGLLSRDNQKEGISIPIGIIPAGSDNSLVWTVLGVRDPISAALAIVKGGLTATDVFAVEWIQTGAIHFGMTVSYYGFVSDVLELSEKYQKQFGPLRYFVAGFLKFLCMPKYSFELEYLPAQKEDHEVVDMADLYTDIMRRSSKEGLPRASSLSSIDSIMTPSRMSVGDPDTTCGSAEPSEYVRGIDPKSKRLSSGRNHVNAEPEVIHPPNPLSTTPNWPRTRSKSRSEKGWSGLNTTSDRTWGNAAMNDREDISSTISDPGPIWDTEPKWDSEPNWDVENQIELPGPAADCLEAGINKELIPRYEEKWVAVKGQYLGILVCNHACRTVQSSHVVAPKAEHDDSCMDLLLVRGSGRWRLLRFFLRLQMGGHLELPYVDYIKVKSVKIKPGKHCRSGCGIDGELFPLNGQVVSSLLPEQCRLIGRTLGQHM